MKNPLTYWKYFVIAGTVNALIFVGYRLNSKYKKMNKLNDKNENCVINTNGKKEDDAKGKK